MRKDPIHKSKSHLNFIRSLPCCLCFDNVTVEAAHLRMGDAAFFKRPMGLGERDDRWVVPLCGKHHRLQHRGAEATFWLREKRNPVKLARLLWLIKDDFAMAESVMRSDVW